MNLIPLYSGAFTFELISQKFMYAMFNKLISPDYVKEVYSHTTLKRLPHYWQ